MSIFDLVTNTIEGTAQVAVNSAKAEAEKDHE